MLDFLFIFEGKVEILEFCEVFKSCRFTNLDWILIRGEMEEMWEVFLFLFQVVVIN